MQYNILNDKHFPEKKMTFIEHWVVFGKVFFHSYEYLCMSKAMVIRPLSLAQRQKQNRYTLETIKIHVY